MLEVDKNTFEDEVLKADGYVLVDYFGDGCVPCAALHPHIEAFAEKYGREHQVLRAQHHQGSSSGNFPEDPGSARDRHLQGRREGRRVRQG